MKAQVRAFAEHAERQQLPCQTIIRDHDGKYSSEVDRAFTRRGFAVKPVGPRAPNLNAFVERWIQSLKHEALNHFIVFGLDHFDHIVQEFVTYLARVGAVAVGVVAELSKSVLREAR